MKKVFKYGTGQEIPEGAVYLTTLVENVNLKENKDVGRYGERKVRLVWHYFLVEVKE
jgi:hypothetical protein